MNLSTATQTFDFRDAIHKNRLVGIWRMMTDFRLPYVAATVSLATSALAKTSVYLLLRFFADNVLVQKQMLGSTMTQTFLWIGLGFIGLALIEGGGSFLSGRFPTGTGMGGPGYEFVNEYSDLTFAKPGVLAMANAGPDTNGSHFFITFVSAPWLDGEFTIFGKVMQGMDVVFAITLRDPDKNPTFEGDMIDQIIIQRN